ncbi:hypothetical protein QWZ10_17470 [Paracoccus cavernae]|uniref:Uncharacterized protein n=1 Tax=Paracoccus cavernae TaxID=1571207 RepID=A0ABT8D8I2_9RHOB|nr:hypothetical protein [Paracoccus cavernae]
MSFASRLSARAQRPTSSALVPIAASQLPSLEREYEIHFGVHDVFPTLIEEVSQSLTDDLRKSGTHVVSPTEFRRTMRSGIVGAKSGEHVKHISEVSLPAHSRKVVISAHGILCDKATVFSTSGLYANVGPAVDGLSQFFAGCRVSLHLGLVPQHSFSAVADGGTLDGKSISWLPLIEKVAKTFPKAPLTLWVIERPTEDAIPFVEDLLGIDISEHQRRMIESIAIDQRVAAAKSPPRNPLSVDSIHLDEVFHNDMNTAKHISSVVFGTDRAIDEFSL